MVIYEEDIELPPDSSERLLKPITKEQANRLLANQELRDKCERTGIDIGMMVANWMLPPAERWRQNYQGAQQVALWDEAGRKAGLKK